jgi:hypothetical protein
MGTGSAAEPMAFATNCGAFASDFFSRRPQPEFGSDGDLAVK